MAIAIKTIPVLEGETAEEFVRRADENAKHATPKLSDNDKRRMDAFLKKSHEFKFGLQ